MKPTTDYDDKMRIHAATVAHRQGRLSRRDLLKYLGVVGVALGSGAPSRRGRWRARRVSLLQDSAGPPM